MSERSLDEAYSILLNVLRAQGLDWVAAQVQDSVRAGKPTTRKVVASRSVRITDRFAVDTVPTRAPKRETLAATEPYTARERVALALDAIEHAAGDTADMEDQTLAFFSSGGGITKGIAFLPEEFEDTPGVEFTGLTEDRRSAVSKLQQVVALLRKEIGSDAGQ